MTIGKNIKQLRKSNGWTQSQLGSMIGVAQQIVAAYEADIKAPSLTRLKKLSKLFAVSLDSIVSVKELNVEPIEKTLHGNSRRVKIQRLFDRLPPMEQRSILKQVTALVEKYGKS